MLSKLCTMAWYTYKVLTVIQRSGAYYRCVGSILLQQYKFLIQVCCFTFLDSKLLKSPWVPQTTLWEFYLQIQISSRLLYFTPLEKSLTPSSSLRCIYVCRWGSAEQPRGNETSEAGAWTISASGVLHDCCCFLKRVIAIVFLIFLILFLFSFFASCYLPRVVLWH